MLFRTQIGTVLAWILWPLNAAESDRQHWGIGPELRPLPIPVKRQLHLSEPRSSGDDL